METLIVTPYNGLYSIQPEKKSNLPGMTIPDQTMSIQEILSRYTRGLSIDDGKVPIYGEDDPDVYDMVNINKMELTDRMDLLQARGEALTKKVEKWQSDQESANKQSIIDEYEKSKPTPPAAASSKATPPAAAS